MLIFRVGSKWHLDEVTREVTPVETRLYDI